MTARSRSLIAAIALVSAMAIGGCSSSGGASGHSDEPAAPAQTNASVAQSSSTSSGTDETGPGTPAPKPLPTMTNVTASVPFRDIEAYAPLMLADYFGEFKKENLNVKIEEVQTNNLVVLMQQGKIDFAPAAPSAGVFNAIAAGADIKGVGGGVEFGADDKQGYYLRKGLIKNGTFDPCDLKGKKVSTGSATGLGSPAVVELAAYLAKCNLTVHDVNIVPLGGSDLLAGLEAGAVDAGYLADPIWPKAVDAGMLLIQPFTASITSYFMGPIRTEKPEVAAAILRALIRTVRTYLQGDYRSDPKVREALIKSLGSSEAELQGPSPLKFTTDFAFPVSSVAPIQDAWLQVGGLLNYSKALPESAYFDDGPRQAALS
jgi:NitT/TauT family transport system substrate-binding protein